MHDKVVVAVFVSVISRIIEILIETFGDENEENADVFNFNHPVKIPIEDFLYRIIMYTDTSTKNMIMWLEYIDKLQFDLSY